MDRDYIWQADYGDRKKLIPFMKELLRMQDAESLQCLSIFVNNDPYNLELFIYLSYNNPQEEDLEFMKKGFNELGLSYRKDLTLDEMFMQMGNRQFNSMTMIDEDMVDLVMDTAFWFSERKEMEQQGYRFGQFGMKKKVFISHSSLDKPMIEQIIPFISAINLNTWVDKYDINVGEPIEKKVFEGIEESTAVILWITKDFLDSKWCETEMESFINKAIEKEVLLISVVSEDVDIENLPTQIQQSKYIHRKRDESIEYIANEIIAVLKKKYNAR